MAQPLRPEGIPVYVEDVVITSPGLSGQVEVYAPGGGGMRGPEDSTRAFREALVLADLAEQLTIEVSDPDEQDGTGGTRGGGGGAEVELEVPGPGSGFGQVMLYAAEDGSLSWHLPDDVAPTEVTSRGGERRTYHVPRSVVVAEPGAGGSRGVLGAVGTKVFKVLLFPLLDPVLGRVGDFFAARWEEKHRRNLVRWIGPDTLTRRDVPAFADADWAALGAGPALLFVHGTFAMSHTAFGALPAEVLAELYRRYGGRIFAIDHFTVSVTPSANIAWLGQALAGAGVLTLDVVTHSRGGLVGRALAERARELGVPENVTVRNLVMVAAPNAGTVLADKDHLSALLDRLTNLIQYVPDNGVTDALGLVLTIVKQLAVGAFGGLEGIMSMNPDGESLKAFNHGGASTATYRVIASDFAPPKGSSLGGVARDAATDYVFGKAANDLVVPTLGAYELPDTPGFPVAEPLVLPASAGVDHCSYFGNPLVSAALLDWLPGE